jgi:hypothetical protein
MFAMPSLTSDLNSGARGSDRRGRLWSSVNGSGTHAGPAFQRLPDWRPPGCNRPEDALHQHDDARVGKIVEEICLDDGVSASTQLGPIKVA